MQIIKYFISYLQCIFIMLDYAITVTGRVNRNVHRLFVPQINANYGKYSLHYRGPVLWNALSTALYSTTTFIQFKIFI